MTNLDTLLTRHVRPHVDGISHDARLPGIFVAGARAHFDAARGVVAHGDDVGLHRVVSGIGCGSGDHDAFVETSLCAVGVVSTCGQDNGALFAHGLVGVVAVAVASASDGAVRPGSIVHGGEFSLRGVASFENEAVRASSEVEADEGETERLAALVHLGVVAAPVVPWQEGGMGSGG